MQPLENKKGVNVEINEIIKTSIIIKNLKFLIEHIIL